jgi:hypothetical protein
MNLAVLSALKKKYKELLLNFDNVNLREEIWNYFQDNADDTSKFTEIEEFIKHVIEMHREWIEEMVEYYPHRKEYWDRVLKYAE